MTYTILGSVGITPATKMYIRQNTPVHFTAPINGKLVLTYQHASTLYDVVEGETHIPPMAIAPNRVYTVTVQTDGGVIDLGTIQSYGDAATIRSDAKMLAAVATVAAENAELRARCDALERAVMELRDKITHGNLF